MDLFTYPQVAGFKRTETSQAAAATVSAPRLRQLCLDQLRLYGSMTADECAANMRRDKLSIRPRFSELRNLGKIEDTGQRRTNESSKRAIVWRLVA